MRHPNIPFSQGLFCLEGKRRPIETALECRLVFGPATSFNIYIYRMGPGVIQQYLEVQFQLYVDI